MSDWSELEVELIIADYFQMLQSEISGFYYSKTNHRNSLKVLLNNRSDGSIEFKHQNISATLINNGLPYIKGYKPRWNYQQLLEKKIIDYLEKNISIEKNFNDFINPKDEIKPKTIQFENWQVSPPDRTVLKNLKEPQERLYKPVKRNYLELEQKNRTIGFTGEELVFQYEKWRLIHEGYPNLAAKVKWISKDEGDGAGFDILSKNLGGKDVFIEVKSTTLGKETPIFISKTENDFSIEKSNAYNLYRLFDLKEQPKMFRLNGKFQDICIMEAINFKGIF